MKLRNKMLFLSMARRGWSPLEARIGRKMRSPEGHEPEDDDDDPTGDDIDDETGEDENNSSQEFDIEQFFSDQPDGISLDVTVPSQEELQQIVTGSISAIKASGILTESTMEAMSSGDFSSFDDAISGFVQAAVKTSMKAMLQVMSAGQQEVKRDMLEAINGHQTKNKDYQALEATIPAAAKPASKVMIRQIFDRAKANHKGNVQKALKDTQAVLSLMGGEIAPPKKTRSASSPVTSWADFLKE